MNRFNNIGIIKNEIVYDDKKLKLFTDTVAAVRDQVKWTHSELINLFNEVIPEFNQRKPENSLYTSILNHPLKKIYGARFQGSSRPQLSEERMAGACSKTRVR
jgi:hypothetical protein